MKLFPICLLLSYFCLGTITTYAQSDSIRTEYGTEDERVSRSEIQRVIRYITRTNVEEKTLIKFGGLPNSTPFSQQGKSFSAGFNLELAVERKLNSSLSILLGFDNQPTIAFYQRASPYSGITGPEWLPDRYFTFNSSAKAAIRYYYSMARRIKSGKSANNFSGTYIAVQARRPIIAHSAIQQYELISQEVQHISRNYSLAELNQPSFALQWGIQQRLGRHGYVDLNAGPEITIYDRDSPIATYNNLRYGNDLSRIQLTLRISAIIGLGW